MNEKARVREYLLKKRAAMDETLRRELSASICKNILSLNEFVMAARVALYFPVRSEADVLSLMSGKDKYYVFPKVLGDDMSFYHAGGIEDFAPGSFDIPEPVANEQTQPEDIDLFIVPGIAFDIKGHRLGYGRGYYDRLISGHPRIVTAGVCYKDFLIERLHTDPWDTRVDYIITDRSVFHTKKEVA